MFGLTSRHKLGSPCFWFVAILQVRRVRDSVPYPPPLLPPFLCQCFHRVRSRWVDVLNLAVISLFFVNLDVCRAHSNALSLEESRPHVQGDLYVWPTANG